MIQVPYTPVSPRPAEPEVQVLLGHPNGRHPPLTLPALLDTGSDRTVIPLSAAVTLGLPFSEDLQFEVAGGAVVTLSVFEASVGIAAVAAFVLEVVAADEPRVLLGRDVLNALHAYFDGPGRMLTLSAQPLLSPPP